MINDFTPQSRRREVVPPPKPTPPDTSATSTTPATPTPIVPVIPALSVAVNDGDETQIVSGSNSASQKTSRVRLGQGRIRGMHFQWPPSRRQLFILVPLLFLLVAGGAAGWVQTHKTVVVVQTAKVKVVPKKPAPVVPKVITSTLTGLPVADDSVNQRPVTGVMIENSPDARPQSALDQAGVVFEAIAEGGITRFLTLFQDSQPDYLGPVRSARPYYVQWCLGFDCSLAHVGGSPEALTDIKSWGVKDLDQFANGGSYQRITSRYAPHNVYTSMDQLNQLEAGKGFGASKFTGFARKVDSPYKAPAATPAASSTTTKSTTKTVQDTRTPASTIDMAISGYYYNTHYDYDAATNTYKRSEGGAAHMSLHKDGSQVQITPKVVIAMVMQYGLEADDHHSQYNVIGSGQAFVFQDGTVTPGTWSKTDAASQVTFTDAAGKVIALNPGQTWLTALSGADQVTYK